ncbi:MAG: 3',5'-cyclic-nucleotide phosphodiesterase [Candidatus Alcyoniella australis]|nr:3',5'-cyclic-nucleotide phosphodiesterase [Candidatus Alcyoniella australis]
MYFQPRVVHDGISMKIEILGCRGDLVPGAACPGYLLDDTTLLEAGTVTSVLSPQRLRRIDRVVLSHMHVDHIKELPFLIGAAVNSAQSPIEVWSTPDNLELLRRHLFNSSLWPDFTRLPTVSNPAMKMRKLSTKRATRVGEYLLRALPVNHTVPTYGMFFDNGKQVLGYTADTGRCPQFWDAALQYGDRLAAVIVEVTFCDKQADHAKATGHMTPSLLKSEVERVDLDVPLIAVHLRPEKVTAIERELRRLKLPVHISESGDIIRL